jgi:hypothetical protein
MMRLPALVGLSSPKSGEGLWIMILYKAGALLATENEKKLRPFRKKTAASKNSVYNLA